MDLINNLRKQSQFTAEWLRANLYRNHKNEKEGFLPLGFEERQFLRDRQIEIQMILLEDGLLLPLVRYIDEEYLRMLAWHCWNGEHWRKISADVMDWMPTATDAILRDIFDTEKAHLDDWALFLWEHRDTMPSWNYDPSRHKTPFSEGQAKNILSAMCSEAIVWRRENMRLRALRAAQAAYCILVEGAALLFNYFTSAIILDESYRRGMMMQRYFMDCLTQRVVPVRSALEEIRDGKKVYDDSHAATFFAW